jgi:flagellar motor protein MotB
MFRRRQILKKAGEGENPFLLTFSDFMASLLAIFILVLIVTLIELDRKKDDLRKREDEISVAKDELLKSLEDIQKVQDSIAGSLQGVSLRERALSVMLKGIEENLATRGIKIELVENGTVLRIPEKELKFASNQFEIPADKYTQVGVIGEALFLALSKDDNRSLLDTVFVEGHTDSQPKYEGMGNWGLSTARAISLWKFWTEKPGKLAALKDLHTLPIDSKTPVKPLIAVSGYADTRSTHGLLEGQELENDRSEDRRIDIRFTLVSSEKQSLEGLQENMKQMREKTDVLIRKLKLPSHAP